MIPSNKVKLFVILFLLGLCFQTNIFANKKSALKNTTKSWTSANPFKTDVFVENLGQFNLFVKDNYPVKYAIYNSDKIFFSSNGLSYRLEKQEQLTEEERESLERRAEKTPLKEMEVFFVNLQWLGCNPDAVIEVSKPNLNYYTYGETGYENIKAKGFNKLTYKNLYPGIDVEYTIPDEGGIKYNLILHPGADLNLVRMKYTGSVENIAIDSYGSIKISTPVGDITDHTPKSFYQSSQKEIKSQFSITDNTIKFVMPEGYNTNKTLVIDPWTTSPLTLSTNKLAYDITHDDLGNVYVSGGSYPFKLAKYNAGGTILWTFTNPLGFGSTGQTCYSRFCVLPQTGSIFIGEGFNYSQGPAVIKINNAGNLVITSNHFQGNAEIWVMFYNKCSGQLIGFGGGTSSSNNLQAIADTNLTSSTILNFNGYTSSCCNDIASAEMDYNGDFYALMSSSSSQSANKIEKGLLSTGYIPPLAFDVNSGYNFLESQPLLGSNSSSVTVKVNALALNNMYLYSYDGKTVKAWNKTTGAALGSMVVNAAYTGGNSRTHEGIAVDECNNVYVGGTNKVHTFTFNGSSFTAGTVITTNISGEVYDVRLNHSSNTLYVCGNGFVTTANATICNTSTLSAHINNTSSNCSNSATVVVSGGTAPYHYHWNNGNNTNTITGVPAGTYHVTITDNSCVVLANSDSIIFTAAGIISVCNDTTICSGDVANLYATGGSSYNWSPAATLNNGTIANPVASPFVSTTYFVTVTNAFCSYSDSVKVSITNKPTITISPANPVICEGQSILLTAHGAFSQYIWDPPAGLSSTTGNSVTANPNSTTSYSIKNTGNNNCVDTGYVSVTVIPAHFAIAGNDTTVCGNNVTLNGSLNSSSMYGHWTGPIGTFFYPSDTTSKPIVNILPFNTTQTVHFWWHQANQSCSDSDEVIITFTPYSGQGSVSAGFPQYVCDSTVTLTGTIQGMPATGHWNANSSNVYFTNQNNQNTEMWFHPTTVNYGLNSKYVVVISFTATSGGCSVTDTSIITFFQKPKAYAGTDNAFCGSTGFFQAQPSISAFKGKWTLVNYSGTGTGCYTPVYGNDTVASSNIQVNCYGIYSFQWREYNKFASLCSSKDTVKIEFIQIPTFSAGNDRWVCGDTVHLHALPSNASTGHTWLTAPVDWYNNYPLVVPADTAAAEQNYQAIAHYTHTNNANLNFIWQEYNVPSIVIPNNPTLHCYKNDTVIVHFFVNYPAIELVDTTWGTLQCGNIYSALNAQQPPEGQGFWYDFQGTTDFHPANTSLHVDSAEVSTYGLHHYVWIVRNGLDGNAGWVCVDTSDVIPIRFYQRPVANAGGIIWSTNPDSNSVLKWDTACGNLYPLHPVLSGPGIGQWIALQYPNINFTSTGSSGTTANPNDTAHTVIYNSDDPINHPYWTFAWVVANGPYQANCTASDTLRITFAQIPNGKIASIKPKCYGQTATIFPGDDPFGKPDHFNWNFGPKHTIEQMVPYTVTTTLNDSIFSVSWDTVGQSMSHVVSLITSNPWGCFSVKTTDTIKEPTPVYPHDSIVATTCFQCNGKIFVFPVGTATYKWTDSEFAGNSSADSITNRCSNQPYHLRFRYQSWNGIDFCVDTFALVIPDTGEVFADFTIIGDTSNLVAGANEVFFTNTTTGGRKYEWRFGDGTTSTAEQTSHIYTKGGVFYVKLYAWSKEGCESLSDSIRITIDAESELEAPNIFSPNGDGHNDYYQVKAKTLKSFDGTIVNRWGKTLFTWTEWDKKKNPGWDGKVSGTPAAPGVYYYIIKAEGWDGIKYELNGAFNLMRDN